MPKKNGAFPRRAWNLLRLALLWARKGGMFKRAILMELRLVPKYMKSSLGNTTPTPRGQLHCLEREMSFDETPNFQIKMHRLASMSFHLPHIPCINPQIEFDDYDFGLDVGRDGRDGIVGNANGSRINFFKNGGEDREDYGYGCEGRDETVTCEDDGIDTKAEEFIAKFYEQMKLQRQMSYLQYRETPDRRPSS